ncbi:hypothetical protein BG015_003629 [Linnemannia schmuckeri]|uniref:Uncharacterized protein n=1 Tax=Linnemannia schmuckeri TaxID=64567 RepID=A0A9P5VDC2_9FUNG|nr:hypothetical protein BG015_003629 [Linnemannia schmuckeri]
MSPPKYHGHYRITPLVVANPSVLPPPITTSTALWMKQKHSKSSSHSSGPQRHKPSRSLLTLSLLLILTTFILFSSTVAAIPQQPPGPQPANGSNGSTPTDNPAVGGSESGDAAKTDANAKPTITSSASSSNGSTATITEAPQPTVITTVTVINGTTTTMTITVTSSAGAGGPAAAPATTLPKAPQSIIIIQDTPYGKVLPAAGPVDDEIESHFWDQYVPHDGAAKSSANTAFISALKKDLGWTAGWRQVFFSTFSVHSVLWTAICVVFAFGIFNA